MNITIGQVEKKFAKSGAPYILIRTSEDQIMSCWEPNLFPLLNTGSIVDVEVETKGNYTTILSANAISKVANTSSMPIHSESVNKQDSIEAQMIVKASCELLELIPDYNPMDDKGASESMVRLVASMLKLSKTLV